MPRYVAGTRSATGSTTLPWMSVFSATATGFVFREAGLFNTTTTAVAAKMMRFTAQGTPGAGLTAAVYDPNAPVAVSTPFTTHSGAPTNGDDLGMRDALGGAVGAGVFFRAAGRGVVVAAGTANGIGPMCATGTSQIVDCWMVWDE